MISLCDGWEFTREWSGDFLAGLGEAEPVRLPHTAGETPLHYAAPEDYALVCGYRRRLAIPEEYRGRRLFLQFDGASHQAQVYINGVMAAEHRCGYTAFRVEISGLARFGEDNTVAVRLDCREDGAIPPFGFVIDYLCYGGLYREAWLDVRGQSYIEDVFAYTPTLTTLAVKTAIDGQYGSLRLSVLDGEVIIAQSEGGAEQSLGVPSAEHWTVDRPRLYTLRAELLSESGEPLDVSERSIGFRTAEFKADGFYLNGERLFLRGLNRHQCWPYIGYAAPESLQREDARILKEELRCNAVRTSHYPQSRYFIDQCDRLGLLVFTELPGWQHIGDESWKRQALENLRELIVQYRSHPSIILWGVRINESADDDEFYAGANALARELDPSRATSGVRFTEKSHLLEDVYAYNDFSHSGTNPGAKPKKAVTPDMDKSLLISEHNGHMFPTKSFDTWEKRQEQALRHARVLSAAASDGGHVGCFGWCMFDYPTHRDFGSGDRVCYHGVLDAFRNPKTAAALYRSQGGGEYMLEVGSPMDIGDYSAGNLGPVYVFTNAESVELYKNGVFVKSFRPAGFPGLSHPPVLIDDTIGQLLETQEGFDRRKAELLRAALVSAGKYGLAGMPLRDKLKMLRCMLRYKMSLADGVALYGKYVGNWGGEATQWRFEAKAGDKTVALSTRGPSRLLRMEAIPSHTVLRERASYDMAAVRIRLLDELGNTACYAQLPVKLEAHGAVAIVGPDTVTAEGGMCGTYVKTLGRAGTGSLRISTAQTDSVTIDFEVKV